MIRLEQTGMGETILVQDGEHVMIADAAGDPVCACGYKPTPPSARSQMHAVSLIHQHIAFERPDGVSG